MSSGVQISKTGVYKGTGAAMDVRSVGFRPRRVELFAETRLVNALWTDTMTEGRGLKRVTGGTMSLIVVGGGVTPLSDGFRIGTDADLNALDGVVHWIAHE